MRRVATLLLAVVAFGAPAPGAGLSLAEAMRQPALQCKVTGSGHGVVIVAIENRGDESVMLDQPAGLVCAATSGDARVITLRATQLAIPAHGAAEATIPAAALSVRNRGETQPFHPTVDAEPRLAGLLGFLAKHNDVPRLTSQLAALCLTEDVTFAQWQQFLSPQRVPPAPGPTPAEVSAAVDALGILRTLVPERTFALAADQELRLRALRNPWSRAKATQLFGLADPSGTPSPLAPDLGTLLHTRPNDNCPICRQRSLMQPREDGF